MDSDVQQLSECFVLSASGEENLFNKTRTQALITASKKYRSKLGSFDIKSMKKLWEVIAIELSNIFKITISAAKCENRWKVLERNYKKIVDNNSKTGRGRKTFEYEVEFDEIFGKKKNIRPTVLLSSNENIYRTKNVRQIEKEQSEPVLPEDTRKPTILSSENNNFEIPEISVPSSDDTLPKVTRKCSVRKQTLNYKKRNEILIEMKNDMKEYFSKKSEQEERKHEERVKRRLILQEYVEILKASKKN